MQHTMLGSLRVSRIGLGAMTMAGTYTAGGGLDDAESIRAIHSALDLVRPTSAPPSRAPCSAFVPTGSISTTSTGSTRTPPSRTPSAP
jgi:hypothetical protein